MSLEVYDDKDKRLFAISDDEALLGSFSVEENYRIHVSVNVMRELLIIQHR